jgi:hypothetical protein
MSISVAPLSQDYQHGWGLVCQTMCLLVTGSFPDKTNPHACWARGYFPLGRLSGKA